MSSSFRAALREQRALDSLVNQLVNRHTSSKMDFDKLAVLFQSDAPRQRDAMLDKSAGRPVRRYLLVILGGKRESDPLASQVKRQRLGARPFSRDVC